MLSGVREYLGQHGRVLDPARRQLGWCPGMHPKDHLLKSSHVTGCVSPIAIGETTGVDHAVTLFPLAQLLRGKTGLRCDLFDAEETPRGGLSLTSHT